MRILITGGAGFIGSAACRHFVLENCEVLNFDKLTYASNLTSLKAVERKANYRFVRGDICDRALLTRVFAEFAPEAVIHCAAESHVDRSITGSSEFIRTNINGTHILLDAVCGYWKGLNEESKSRFRFHHISTDEVFGSLGSRGAFNELTAYDPRSPYSASKAASDHLVMAWHHTYGLPVVMSNCSNNYGPYHFPEKLIPLTILNALEGKPIAIYGDGLNTRDWLYVEDHVCALAAVLAKGVPGQKYVVGGGSERTNLQVVQTICSLLDEFLPIDQPRRDLISFVVDRPGHDRRYAIDASRIQRELGWSPRETFETGIRKTVRWYLDHPEWWQPIRAKIYDGRRLGLTNA